MDKIFCYNCIHFNDINLCKTRGQLVRPQKGRYCQDFVDMIKILKTKEEIPQPVKIEEKVPVEVKKVSLIRRILNYLIRRLKWILGKK